MEKDFINYGERINRALLQVIKDILLDLSKERIAPNHCFYITYDTNHPDVLISPKLKKEYPKEITIVIQNQFWNLEVRNNFFNVTLSFNRKKETLSIPFEAIKKFNDPFVKFSLQLDLRIKNIDQKNKEKKLKKVNLENNKIIKLSKFRKDKDE